MPVYTFTQGHSQKSFRAVVGDAVPLNLTQIGGGPSQNGHILHTDYAVIIASDAVNNSVTIQSLFNFQGTYGDLVTVANGSNLAISVYPPSGGSINGLSVNSPVSVPADQAYQFRLVSGLGNAATQWICNTGSGGGGGGGTGVLLGYTSGPGQSSNVSPSNFSSATGRLDVTLTGDSNWTGLLAGTDGQTVIIRNLPTNSNLLTLNVGNVFSLPANQFSGSSDAYLSPGQTTDIVYYGGSVNLWVIKR